MELANLFRPWILARLISSGAAALLVAYGMFVGWRVLRYFRVSRTTEGQLALERRAELVSVIVEVALAISAISMAIAVLGAERMSASTRGAMCAWGVLDASPYGFASLGIAALSSLACALWIALHRLDLALARPALTRLKFQALFVVGPLVLADFGTAARFALDLDFRVVASCCSTGLDAARELANQGSSGGPREIAAGAFLALSLAAVLSGALTVCSRRRGAALLTGVTSALAGAVSLPAVVWWVAPHVYETPVHLCPFCLLHADALGIGWPLFGSIFLAIALGLSTALVAGLERASGEPEVARAIERRLARGSALAWSTVLILSLAPVVSWYARSGGVSLFGG